MMRKTTTKFFILVFLGLLSLTVPFSHVRAEDAADTTKSHGGAHGILIQDGWQYMKENSAEWEAFSNTYGDSEKNRSTNAVPCGATMCNLEKNICLRKESRGWFRDWVSSYAALSTFGLIGDVQKTTNYEYKCVKKGEVSKYTSNGWYDVGRNEKNLKRSTTDTFGGDVTETRNKTKACYSAKNKKGELQQYCIEAIDDTIVVKAADSKGKGCEVIPVRWYNNRKCTFCSLLGGAYKVSDIITTTARTNLAKSFAIVIALGLMIWIAVKTLAFVSSMTKQDAAKYITETMKQSYKFMIAFFALLYYDDIFAYIILPLLNAGIDFGYNFVSVMSLEDRFGFKDIKTFLSQSDIPSDYARNLDNNFYAVTTYMNLENLAYNVNLQYSLLQTIGGSLMCLGGNYVIGFKLGLGFACIVYGLAFWAFGFLLCLAFVFYLFDAVVQLGIVGGLLPFLIASWPFKITAKYTSTGFKMLLNSIFTFMMIGVVVNIGMELINVAVELNANPEEIGEGINSAGTDLAALTKAIDEMDDKKLAIMVNVLSIGFCLFMFANIMGFLLIARMSELVNRFAGGGMKGAAPSIATIGASTVRGMATKLAAPTMDAVGKWANDTAEKGVRAVARAPIGAAKFIGQAGKSVGKRAGNWIDKKTNHAISKGVNKVANSSFGQSVKEVREELTNKPTRKDAQRGLENTQKNIFDKKDNAVLGGNSGAADNNVVIGGGRPDKTRGDVASAETRPDKVKDDVVLGGRRPRTDDMD